MKLEQCYVQFYFECTCFLFIGTSVTIELAKSSHLGLLDPSLPSVYIKGFDGNCTELNYELEAQYINCAAGKLMMPNAIDY